MPRRLLIDEWLWSDITNSGTPSQRMAAQFLMAVIESADVVVMVVPSKFTEKFWHTCKHPDLRAQALAGQFKDRVFFNSARSEHLNLDELEDVPSTLASVNSDDHYLVRAIVANPGITFVTSDSKLLKALKDFGHSTCYHRDEFLPGYVRS